MANTEKALASVRVCLSTAFFSCFVTDGYGKIALLTNVTRLTSAPYYRRSQLKTVSFFLFWHQRPGLL